MKVQSGYALLRKMGTAALQGGFARKVLVLAGGTAFAQGIVVLLSPVLTRLYAPEDFGVLAVYVSIVAIMTVVASLRYEIAIPLPKEEEAAVNLVVLSLVSVVVMSVMFGIGTVLFGGPLVDLLNEPALASFLWLMPVSLLGIGTYQALSFWALRNKNYAAIARTKVNQSISQVVLQLGLGTIGAGKLGLLLGDAAGRVGGSGSLLSLLWKEGRKQLPGVSWRTLLRQAYAYRKFPLVSSWSALCNGIGFQIMPLLITMLYGVHVAGWFVLGQRVIGAPLVLVGNAVAQVYIGEGSQLVRDSPATVQRLYWQTAKRLLKLGAAPFAIVTLCGPWLFELVYGGAWTEAGRYVQVMGVMYFVQFVVVPLSPTLNMLERQNWQFYWDIGRLVLMVGGLWLAERLEFSALYAIGMYSVLMTVAYAALFLVSAIAVRQNMRASANEQ